MVSRKFGRSQLDSKCFVVNIGDFVEVAVKGAHFGVFVVAPEDGGDDGVIGQVLAVAVSVVDLQGFAVAFRRPASWLCVVPRH